MKLFKRFIAKLAQSLGCTVQALLNQGYRYEMQSDKPKISIPDSDHASLFRQFINGASLTALFPKPKHDPEQNKEEELDQYYSPSMLG